MVDLLGRARRELRRGRQHLRTVRGRSALLSAVVVAVVMTLGAVLMVVAFRISLQNSIDSTLEQQVRDRITLIDRGTDPAALVDALEDESLVWIGRPDGTEIAVGGSIIALVNPVPDTVGTTTTATLRVEEVKPDEIEIEDAELRLASGVSADGNIVVVTGAETERLGETLAPLIVLFAVAIPLLTLLVAVLAWIATRRALGPVENIRQQAMTVSGTSLAERVPVPTGEDEIHDLAITMNEMLERLDTHERSLRQFTADASHELKSPVANIRALVDTAHLDDGAEWSDLRTRLAIETDRLSDLVDNLLFLARRSDAGATLRNDRTVHLDDLLFDEAEMLSATKRVAVNIDGVEPTAIVGDPAAMQRMVRNLADNAARHATSTVWFACAEHGDVTVLTIHDDGQGIADADRERVFERFTRLDEARDRDVGGAGLGLAIVQQIAADHDATVRIDGAAEAGTTVVVEFAPSSTTPAPGTPSETGSTPNS